MRTALSSRARLNNFIRKDAPGIVTRSIMSHVSEVMTNHYSIVNADGQVVRGVIALKSEMKNVSEIW